MQKSAISLVLIMITGSLAGCLAGDSDGVPEISLTDEDITGLFDDYFMDFVNNSSVTVVNEIHYHNNTTSTDSSIFNEGDSSSSVNFVGSGENGMLYALDAAFDFDSLVDLSDRPDFRSRTFTVSHTYYDAALDQMMTNDTTVSCGDYYLVGAATGNTTTWWENNNNYWDAWSQAGYNNTYSEILSNNGYAKADYCDENRWLGLHNGYVSEWFELHTIEIPPGYALKCAFDDEGVDRQQRMLVWNSGSETWQQTTPYSPIFGGPYSQYGVQMGESTTGFYHDCGIMYGNGSGMDYTIWVNGFNEEDLYRFVFYYELVPVIGADSGVTYGEWINEVGNASEPWSLSLEDDEWLEVKSAQIITSYGGQGNLNLETAFICDNDNTAIFNSGHSPIFGGDYQIYPPNFITNSEEIRCDLSGASLVDWSIIYRIHSV